jgi:hypothetical protein
MSLKLFKITCLAPKQRTGYKGVTDNDIEMFEQYVFPQNIIALCPLKDEDRLPNAECLMVIAGGGTFQTTEPLLDLVDRVNKAVEENE